MANEIHGDLLTGSFCGMEDIQDISQQFYEDGSRPNISTATRSAELQAVEITLWLNGEGYGRVEPGGTEVTGDDLLARALRRLNALMSAQDLLTNTDFRDRPELSPDPSSLQTMIDDLMGKILGLLSPDSAGSRGLESHVTTGDTLQEDPGKGQIDPGQKDMIRVGEKF